jgi:hypothetical protein
MTRPGAIVPGTPTGYPAATLAQAAVAAVATAWPRTGAITVEPWA